MTCLIIAAGRGSRLAERTDSKPLLAVAGRRLIEWVIRAAARVDIRDFVVVTGYHSDQLQRFLAPWALQNGFSVACVYNPDWERENGLSVLRAKESLRDNFFLLMADHIFDEEIMSKLRSQKIAAGEVILAVDSRMENNPDVDWNDVTKVRVRDGSIVDIGKTISDPNAFDCGVFLCTPAIFTALEESARRGDFTLSGGMRVLAERGKARAFDIGDLFWIDVDDETALRKAESRLCRHG